MRAATDNPQPWADYYRRKARNARIWRASIDALAITAFVLSFVTALTVAN